MKRQKRTWAAAGGRGPGARARARSIRRLARFDRLESRTLMAANVAEYPIYPTGGGAVGITSGAGADTNLYFTLPSSNSLGVYNPVAAGAVAQYAIPTPTNASGAIAAGYSGAGAIATGGDGNVYFLESAANQIGEFNVTTHQFSEFPLLTTPGAGLTGLATGPDGNLWFTEFNANQIGTFNVSTHQVSEFAVPTASGQPDGIASDPADGLLWFTEYGTNNVGFINATTHVIKDFTAPSTGNQGNAAIAYDATNQTVYFLETQAKQIGSINPKTDAFGTAMPGPTDTAQADQMTVDPSGNVWFTEMAASQVGILNTSSGTVKQVSAGFNAMPEGIAPGADGNLWFTTIRGSQLNPVSLGGLSQTAVAIPSVGNSSPPASIAADPNGNLWFTVPLGNAVGEFNTRLHTSTLVAISGNANRPQQIALDTSDGSLWFTSDQPAIFGNASAIVRLDPASGAVTNTIAVPANNTGSQGIAYNNPSSGKGDGNLYFAEQSANTLGLINPTTKAISGHAIPAGETQPYGVAADANGNVWVTMYGSGTVDRFNPSTAQWLATPIALSGGANSHPEGITLGPDGNLWVAEAGNGKVAVINPGTLALVTEFAASATGEIAVGPDGNVWISQATAVASIVPASPYTITPYATPDANPQGLAIGGDGNLYFAGPGAPINIATNYPNTIGAVTTAAASQAASLAFTTQPTTVTAGKAFGVVVSVENPAGQVDPFINNFSPLTGSVTLSLGANPGGATLGGTLTAPVINGQAVFSGLTLGAAAKGYTLNATYNGLSATSGPINVGLAATRLVVTTAPPATVPDGSPFSIAVSAEDASGNVDTSYNGPIDLKLGSNPGNATFATVTAGANNGVATFSNLVINQLGAGYTLAATTASGTLTAGTSGAFNVVPGAVTQLVITTEPVSSATPATPLSLVVKAEDANNTVNTSYNGTLTASLAYNPYGAQLLGAGTPFNFVNGVANVSGLTITKPGIGYTIGLTSGMLSTTSTTITITPAPASQFVLSFQPTGDATAGQTFNLTVQAEDSYGNATPTYTGTVMLSSTDPLVSLPSYTLRPFDQGSHTFQIALDTAGMQTLTATDVNNPGVTGNTTVVVDPGPTALFAATPALQTTAAGSPAQVTFTAEDAYGNPTPGYGGAVQLGTSDPGVTPPSPYMFTATDAGVHTFHVAMATAGSQSVTLTDASNSMIAGSAQVDVTPGPTAKFVVGVTGPVRVGSPYTVQLMAEDGSGNVTPGYTGTVNVTTTDAAATLPSSVTFTPADAGVHVFQVTPGAVGSPQVGVADASNPAIAGSTAVTVNQAITNALLTTVMPGVTYGQSATFNIAITPVAGLAPPTGTVQFLVDGKPYGSPVALIGGSAASPSIAGLGAGSHTVTVMYPGDPIYAPESSNSLTIVVNQAPLILAVNNLTRYYGQANPTLTYKVLGLANGDTAATALTGSPSLATIATQASTPGAYPITIGAGTLASTNYSITMLQPGNLTVAKAPITVVATGASRPYGHLNPTFTYTLSGLANGDLGGVIQGAPALTTTAVPGSPAGSYPITVGLGTLSAANYSFTNLIGGTLTVTGQAPAEQLDMNGLGTTDLTVFRPKTDQWFSQYPGGGLSTQFGDPKYGDLPAPADYQGIGKADLAVFRPGTDQWIIRLSTGMNRMVQFGDPKHGDIPVPGDYEGNGKADLAVFDPTDAKWIILLSTGKTEILQFGDPTQGDLPVPGFYDGGGKLDLAVFRPSTDQWIILESNGTTVMRQLGDPMKGDIPVPGDYDGDTITDLAVYRPSTAQWIIQESTGPEVMVNYGDPTNGDVAATPLHVDITVPTPPVTFSALALPASPGSLAIVPWTSTDPTTGAATKPKSKSNALWLTALDELAGHA